MQQSRIEKTLTTLLKMALHNKPCNEIEWAGMTDNDWKSCYQLAVKHGVMAVAWDGLQLLPAGLQPSRPIKLSWAVAVRNYEEWYERYCHTADELSSLYAGHGIAMVQLKGVGMSSYYPVPSHREGGDIDIYTYSADLSKLSDNEANSLADKLMKDMGIEVDDANSKHSNFVYRGIPIENHKSFLALEYYTIAKEMNEILHELLLPQETPLCDGKYHILTPSPEFNALFLSFHAGQHYCSGFRLHHLFDWACMLKKHGLPLSEKVTDRKLLRFIHALTQLCNILFETDVKVPINQNMTEEVYMQIMHPRFSGNAPKNKIGVFLYKTGRLFYRNHKQSKVFDRSLLREVWYSIIFHFKRPDTILTIVDK